MTIAMTSPLRKTLDKLLPTAQQAAKDHSGISVQIASLLKQNSESTLAIIRGIETNLEILEDQKNRCSDAIAVLEEAGGLTVRARHFMTTPEDAIKYRDKTKEFEIFYTISLKKLDTLIQGSSCQGINLLNGDSLLTPLDTKSQTVITTQGISLTSETLGIRAPDFATMPTLQSSRIDIMNAMDMAVTLRNIITSDIETLQIRKDLALSFIELSETARSNLSKSEAINEMANLIRLMNTPIFSDESLAEPEQQEILTNFLSSPHMEDKE